MAYAYLFFQEDNGQVETLFFIDEYDRYLSLNVGNYIRITQPPHNGLWIVDVKEADLESGHERTFKLSLYLKRADEFLPVPVNKQTP
ncbi:hypothetical protein N4G41_00220 [Kosakonia sacchari]|uniref:hypothetical protein n=1 Tax=Kosakonia sacchari TaxID=1158459 RepID=UPI002ACDE0A3|nr:hypothetical protein [Kosakonia sacchari]MDZ7320062.1 hypothetical protein [Kosakonia sacchari]